MPYTMHLDHIHVQTVPMTNSILTPHTFYIFWIFCTFTDDCLDSNFIHFRQTNINLVSFNQSIWITSVSKLSHDQFNPCPFTCKFLMCQVLVKILILKHYFYFPKIPNYHYCRILTVTSDKCFLEYLRYFLKDHRYQVQFSNKDLKYSIKYFSSWACINVIISIIIGKYFHWACMSAGMILNNSISLFSLLS